MSATNKAGYTATGWGRGSDEKANPSYWAGVVMQKPLLNDKKTDGDGLKDRRTDRWTEIWTDERPASRTDEWTDGRNGQMEKLRNGTTDIAGYKVACTRLKMGFNPETRPDTRLP